MPSYRCCGSASLNYPIKEFNTIYERLGVRFDLYRGESFYNDALPEIIQQLEEHNLATLKRWRTDRGFRR